MTCVVRVGDLRVIFTPMSRLTCPTHTGWPSQRNGASHSRMWLRCEMFERPRCRAMSCLRPNAYSELTGAVRMAFSAIAAPTMRRTLSTVIASVKVQPLAAQRRQRILAATDQHHVERIAIARAVGIGRAARQSRAGGAQFVQRQVGKLLTCA